MAVPTSASKMTGDTADRGLADKLADIVGAENVRSKAEQVAVYFPGPADSGGLVGVRPSGHGEVQEILRLASSVGMPVRTLNDRYLRPADEGQEGIVLDFFRMQEIEKLDKRNLLVHLQRGVTFEGLKKELDAQGLKIATPLAATSDSVLCNTVNRAPLKKATVYPEVHVFPMQVVMADGTFFRTGSHALGEQGADLREDGGPSLSRWFFGSDDIFGVITRATIFLYPKAECRDAFLFGFEDLEEAVAALRNGPRTEQGWEYLVANKRFLASLLGVDNPDLPPWTLIVGFDGREKLVAYQKKKVQEIMSGLGAKPVDVFQQEICGLLDEVWYQASPLHTGFYAACNRVKEFDDLVQKRVSEAGLAPDDVGHCLLAIDRGRCVYSQYDIFGEASPPEDMIGTLERDLAAEGAFFDRPQGALADDILDRVPNLREHLRVIKEIMDPECIINPGRYVSKDDPQYCPPTVEVATEEDTGIEESNVRVVADKLKEIVGERWVSTNRADLAAYGRDFTIYSGERPNIVVLPQSTEEMQGVMRIAYQHKIPVVPLTTGFNHGGLTIPRKGGLLVDLKRMNQLLEIDEESLTVTFQPGVRMRNLWQECNKIASFQDIKLKPILPLSLASISLLSNYVSRGGPGSAVKYGGGPDLTVNMTWVLPNGEILHTGPSAQPKVGNLGIHWGSGPDIGGMFFNADGAFGVCTQITTKLYPDMPCEEMIHTAVFDEDPVGFEKACDSIYDIAQETLAEFMYKSHPGVMCVTLAGALDADPLDLVSIAPKHPLEILITGLDEEEIEIRGELVREILARHEVLEIDPAMFGEAMSEMISTDPVKMSVGVKNNFVGAFRGAFQWQAGYVRVDQIPAINEEYKKLVKKYWKTSDVKMTMESALTGTDIQGPLAYARVGTVEFDYWWDQGNPESVKRATVLIRKTTELMFRNGIIPIRNMFGYGELLLPQLDVYADILRNIRGAFDPANLMHPDVLPVTEDYV